MTVQELIDALLSVKDKSLPVKKRYWNDGNEDDSAWLMNVPIESCFESSEEVVCE